MKTKECEKCKRQITLNNIKLHEQSCDGVIKKTVDDLYDFNIETEKYKCPYCNKEYTKKGIATHVWRMHGDGKDWTSCNDGLKDGTRQIWNKGLTKETNTSLKQASITLKNGYDSGELIPSFLGKHHSEETKQKLSIIAKENKLGGVTQSRWIKYKGKTLGSSYELEVAKSLDKNNVLWDTCKRISYIDNLGKNRTYTPDIYLKEYNVYLDPKNDFLIENINPNLGFMDIDKIKWVEKQNNITVIVLNKTQLNWEYIKTKLSKKT